MKVKSNQETDALPGVKRKRGRPKGWKKNLQAEKELTHKRRGRPKGSRNKLQAEKELTYKGSQHNKTVNDVVVKEKLIFDLNLGIDRNLPVEKIIGATIELGFPAFLVTWQGSDEADLLPAETCKRKYPQPLIQFFEEHIFFPDK